MLLHLRRLLRNWLILPITPGPIYLIWEKPMASVFRVKAMLPPVVDPDVDRRELTSKIGDQDSKIENLALDTAFVEFVVPQDSTLELSLVDIDDAGNRSEPSVRSYKAIDNIPPMQPGMVNIEVMGEEHI